jgi:hypothetical protein
MMARLPVSFIYAKAISGDMMATKTGGQQTGGISATVADDDFKGKLESAIKGNFEDVNRMMGKIDRKYFDAEKGKCFPPAHEGGDVIMPHYPTDFERRTCGYAQKGFDCSSATKGPLGGKSRQMNCAECFYHPHNYRA